MNRKKLRAPFRPVVFYDLLRVSRKIINLINNKFLKILLIKIRKRLILCYEASKLKNYSKDTIFNARSKDKKKLSPHIVQAIHRKAKENDSYI